MTDNSEKKATIEYYTDALCAILADRLPLSRTWNQVSFEHKKGRYQIIWFDSKHMDDPSGEKEFRSHGGPYTLEGIHKEIANQLSKLSDDGRLRTLVG